MGSNPTDTSMNWQEGYEAIREIGGTGRLRYVALFKLTFGRMRLVIVTSDGPGEHW